MSATDNLPRSHARAAVKLAQVKMTVALVRLGDAAQSIAHDPKHEGSQFADLRRHATSLAARAEHYQQTASDADIQALSVAANQFSEYTHRARTTAGMGDVLGACNQLQQKVEAFQSAYATIARSAASSRL